MYANEAMKEALKVMKTSQRKLAFTIGKDQRVVNNLLTKSKNMETKTIVDMLSGLGGELVIKIGGREIHIDK